MAAFFFIAVMAGEILFTEALDRFVHPESRLRLRAYLLLSPDHSYWLYIEASFSDAIVRIVGFSQKRKDLSIQNAANGAGRAAMRNRYSGLSTSDKIPANA